MDNNLMLLVVCSLISFGTYAIRTDLRKLIKIEEDIAYGAYPAQEVCEYKDCQYDGIHSIGSKIQGKISDGYSVVSVCKVDINRNSFVVVYNKPV